MGRIKILPEQVANKIAAGEVVERPASVVKELMENALDAGATSVAVAVGHGGKSFIRVQDNGCGMDPDDARLCVVRHATSKIATAEDIHSIASLGFRGEALPSIAAVSRLRLITRTAAAPTATLIRVTGGVIAEAAESVAEPGTTVEVEDLFFNTPGRKKFLKPDTAEYNAIADVFDTLALARSEVSFTLSSNRVPAAAYDGTRDVLERIAQVYGDAVAERMLPVALTEPGLSLHGYIAAPELSRVNRTGQKIFINSRPVQSLGVSLGLSRAYEEFLERGRFPVAVLFLDIPHEEIDVNVHPAKREVRIRNERMVIDKIAHIVKNELRRTGVALPTAAVTSGEAGTVTVPRAASGSYRPLLHLLREQCAGWGQQAPPSSQAAQGAAAVSVDWNETDALHDPSPQPADPFRGMTVIGQALDAYIVAACEEGLALFDQHAAHERILFETLLRTAAQHVPASQTVLFPAVLHLSLQEAQLMEQYAEDFAAVGFGINSLGGGSFSVDAVPACMADIDAAAVLKDCLHELLEDGSMRAVQHHREALAAVLACKTHAVKAGKPLSREEMAHLIEQLGRQDNPHVCPHGRPTFFILTRREIERRLKRT